MNESPYSYIRGLLVNHSIIKFPEIKESMIFILKDAPSCYHCLSLLLDCYSAENNKEKCIEIIDSLIIEDSIRKKYWQWRKNQLDKLN